MRDRATVPFARLRTAGFIGILLGCAVLAAVNFDSDADDSHKELITTGLCFIVFCAVLCRLLYYCSHKMTFSENQWRIRRCEEKINGYDESFSRYFPEIMQSGGLEPRPMKAVPDDGTATGGSGRGVLRLAFSRRESPR